MSREIPLTRGKVAIVDDNDYEALSAFKWHALHPNKTRWYAVRSTSKDGRRVMIYMHRVLLSPGDSTAVDHINGDGLDNRRANIRPCTVAENNANTSKRAANRSGYKGVSYDARTRNWAAFIGHDGKHTRLGRFPTAEAAHEAYRQAAMRIHGQFARFE